MNHKEIQSTQILITGKSLFFYNTLDIPSQCQNTELNTWVNNTKIQLANVLLFK
jgi:hypothetical protein